jgi:hypothetical protein
VTTKGDNRKQAKEEAERLMFSWANRVPALGAEFGWACGMPMPKELPSPPEWVRKAIFGFGGLSGKESSSRTITREDVAHLIGMLRGLHSAGEIALKSPIKMSGASDAATKRAAALQQVLATALRPTWATAKRIQETIPEERYKQTLGEVSAAHRGQKEASDFVCEAVNLDSRSDSITDEILFFLWVCWPEVETAKSVAELHNWMTRIQYVSCSPKTLEKICTKIGFRKTKRGRKKRIPTPAR